MCKLRVPVKVLKEAFFFLENDLILFTTTSFVCCGLESSSLIGQLSLSPVSSVMDPTDESIGLFILRQKATS